MATAASGVFKKVARKREVTYGLLPAAAGAQLLRRVKCDIDLDKATYKSNEIRPDLQVADFRHGVRSVPATLAGELSPGAYADEVSSVLKRDFAAVAAIAGASITIGGAGPAYTVTRAAGSFLTDGVKIGDIVQLSVGVFNAANITKNLWVTGVTALVLNVLVLNNSALVAEGPIAGSTVTVMGKKTFIPTTGHTAISYAIELFYSDIAQSEVYGGIRWAKLDIQLPPTGIATITFTGTGKDLLQSGTVQYFTTPGALTTAAVVAAVNGDLTIGGVLQATVTGLQLTVEAAFAGDPVVGANTVPQQFAGTVTATGQATMQFVDNVARDAFINETESSLAVAFTSDNTAAAQALAITCPRIKFSGAKKADQMQSLVLTLPFQCLLNVAGGAGIATEQTTLMIQDTAAP